MDNQISTTLTKHENVFLETSNTKPQHYVPPKLVVTKITEIETGRAPDLESNNGNFTS